MSDAELREIEVAVNLLRSTSRPQGWRLHGIEIDHDAKSVEVRVAFTLPDPKPTTYPKKPE